MKKALLILALLVNLSATGCTQPNPEPILPAPPPENIQYRPSDAYSPHPNLPLYFLLFTKEGVKVWGADTPRHLEN